MFGDDTTVDALPGPDFDAWLSVTDRRRLAEVYEALDRIDQGCYGLCAGCGAPIDHVRLESIPWVRLCGGCANRRGHAEQELEAA